MAPADTPDPIPGAGSDPITLREALRQLAAAWPSVSFKVECEVWSHVYDDGRAAPSVEWSIYHAERRTHDKHATLAGALVLALGQPMLADAERVLAEPVAP